MQSQNYTKLLYRANQMSFRKKKKNVEMKKTHDEPSSSRSVRKNWVVKVWVQMGSLGCLEKLRMNRVLIWCGYGSILAQRLYPHVWVRLNDYILGHGSAIIWAISASIPQKTGWLCGYQVSLLSVQIVRDVIVVTKTGLFKPAMEPNRNWDGYLTWWYGCGLTIDIK